MLTFDISALKTYLLQQSRVDVQWDIKVKGFFELFKGMIKKHISEGSEDALERIFRATL